MTAPLLGFFIGIPFIFSNPNYPIAYLIEIRMLLLWKPLIVGRIVSLIGIVIFTVAAIQWLWYHRKKIGLFTKGLYSKSRHPQFLGIIITTMGLTIMVLTVGPMVGATFDDGGLQQLVVLWFLQVLGYMTIAFFEERSLSKKFGDQYKQYAQKVPFIFPVRCPRKVPDYVFTLLILVLICMILFLLPYELIRIYSSRLPNSPFTL